MSKAVATLRDRILDPAWSAFNYHKIAPDDPNGTIEGLNQAVTPPFGLGGRLVWLEDTPLCQQCSEELLTELERTLGQIPDSSVLLLTSRKKPDRRLKSTKLLFEHAEVKEFSPIPPWKTDLLAKRVTQVAQEVGVKLTPEATELLAESVGNQTRQLYGELEKLRLYAGETGKAIDAEVVSRLVTANTQNSLQLADAIRRGEVAQALDLVMELIARNEPALRIVATLVGQFRRWLWVKLAVESGERDNKAIAQLAEIGNPKRVYFLRQEVQSLSLSQLRQTLSVLLELEVSLKRGADEMEALQTKAIQLCDLYRPLR